MGRKALPKLYVGLIGWAPAIRMICAKPYWESVLTEDRSYGGERPMIDLNHRRKKVSVSFVFAHATRVYAAFITADTRWSVDSPLRCQRLSSDDAGIAVCAGTSLQVEFDADDLRALRRTL